MLVLNLRVSSHKIVASTSEDGDSSVYSSPKKRTAKTESSSANDDEILAASKPTELTEEQKKYLDIYENEHDKYFGSKKRRDNKAEVKVYVSSTKDEKKSKASKRSISKASSNAPMTQEKDKTTGTVISDTKLYDSPDDNKSKVEVKERIVEVVKEVPVEVVKEVVKEVPVEVVREVEAPAKENIFSKFFNFVKNIFKKKRDEEK